MSIPHLRPLLLTHLLTHRLIVLATSRRKSRHQLLLIALGLLFINLFFYFEDRTHLKFRRPHRLAHLRCGWTGGHQGGLAACFVGSGREVGVVVVMFLQRTLHAALSTATTTILILIIHIEWIDHIVGCHRVLRRIARYNLFWGQKSRRRGVAWRGGV